MSAGSNIAIIALADLFDDKLALARKAFNGCNAVRGLAEIQNNHIHRGSAAYLRLLDHQDIDAVLISTTAYAHPEILGAAVAAGKHAYCEKPAAIDIDGCRRVLRLGEKAGNRLTSAISSAPSSIIFLLAYRQNPFPGCRTMRPASGTIITSRSCRGGSCSTRRFT
jgi:myo-inositol 2-dehydrogenase/D-chiro-inositol 1-dehydrogenase